MSAAERAHYIALLRAGHPDGDWIVALLNDDTRAKGIADVLARKEALGRSVAEGK